jgi:hypothetical protein
MFPIFEFPKVEKYCAMNEKSKFSITEKSKDKPA